jgi:Domain of unknown function (DUF5134)
LIVNMSGPTWLADFFAAVMLIVAGYSGGRLIAGRVWNRPIHVDIDVTHFVMGVAMAGMLAPALSFGSEGFWVVIFTVVSLWFAYELYGQLRTRQAATGRAGYGHNRSHSTVHLVMGLSMIYMYVAPSSSAAGGMPMGATSGLAADFTWVPLIFLLTLIGSSIYRLDGLGRLILGGPAERFVVAAAAGPGSGGAAKEQVVSPCGLDDADRHRDHDAIVAPGLETVSHVGMVITMAYMLVVML